jgi:hypothetical protein
VEFSWCVPRYRGLKSGKNAKLHIHLDYLGQVVYTCLLILDAVGSEFDSSLEGHYV